MEQPSENANIKFICGDTICYPQTLETDCALYKLAPQNHRTVKFEYREINPSKSSKSQEITKQTLAYFTPSPTSSWQEDIENKDLRKLFFKCWQDFKQRNGEMYTTTDLPRIPTIPPGTIGRGYVVQFRHPWDFHIMLQDTLDYAIHSKKCQFATINSELKLFETSTQLMHGLELLLLEFVKFALSRSKKLSYKTGDLVISLVSRQNEYKAHRTIVLNQGHVIVKNFVEAHSCLCYLIDTGETLTICSEFLHPLPYVFVGFPPLAIKCALHGVFPIAPDWSIKACSKMLETVTPANRTKLTVEFYSKNPVHIPAPESNIISTSRSDAYFVELFARKDGNIFSNVSNLLISEDLAIEWCLTPQRPELQERRGNPLTEETKEDALITRDDILHFCRTTPQEMKLLPPDQIGSEIRKLVNVQPSYFSTAYLKGYSNTLCLKIEDPSKILSRPSVPTIFTESITEEPVKALDNAEDNELSIEDILEKFEALKCKAGLADDCN